MSEPAAPNPAPEPLDLPAGMHRLCSCGYARSHRYPLCDSSHAAPPASPWWRPWGWVARSCWRLMIRFPNGVSLCA
jgi:CDGSH iron-sulfur domain-containing protein 3